VFVVSYHHHYESVAIRGNDVRLTSFRPVVSSTTLAKDKVVRSEQVTEGTRPYRVHSTGLKVNQDRTGNVLVRANFVVVDVDAFELKVIVSLVLTIAVNAVFV
jgi:hypothetical protein